MLRKETPMVLDSRDETHERGRALRIFVSLALLFQRSDVYKSAYRNDLCVDGGPRSS